MRVLSIARQSSLGRWRYSAWVSRPWLKSPNSFPALNRPEVIIDLWLPEGSSFTQTEAAAKRMEALLAQDEDVVNYATYLGVEVRGFFCSSSSNWRIPIWLNLW